MQVFEKQCLMNNDYQLLEAVNFVDGALIHLEYVWQSRKTHSKLYSSFFE